MLFGKNYLYPCIFIYFFKGNMEKYRYTVFMNYAIAETSPFPSSYGPMKSSGYELGPSCEPPCPPVLNLWKSSGIFMSYAIAVTPLPPVLDLEMEKFRNRVSISHPFFCFAKHETKQNKKFVPRNFTCFTKQNKQQNFVSFRFVKSKISFRFVIFFLVLFHESYFPLLSFIYLVVLHF
jgi:hypothetical protein